MTKAQAQACVAAIVGAGFDARAHLNTDLTWTVRANSGTFSIPVASAVSLATSQGVVANVAEVEFT